MIPEIQAMETCLNALDELTPEERQRAVMWLYARIYSDLEKGLAAASIICEFLQEAREAA